MIMLEFHRLEWSSEDQGIDKICQSRVGGIRSLASLRPHWKSAKDYVPGPRNEATGALDPVLGRPMSRGLCPGNQNSGPRQVAEEQPKSLGAIIELEAE